MEIDCCSAQALTTTQLSKYLFLSFLFLLTCGGICFLRSKLGEEFSDDQLKDGIKVFVFGVSVFVYLPVDIDIFFFSGFSCRYLFFLHQAYLFFCS